MIYRERYAGGRTIFGFFEQCFLLLPQVLVTWQTAAASHRRGFALSLFRSEQVSYNALLPQYRTGRHFVPIEAQWEEARREEMHGVVLDSAAAYLQERLRVAEKAAGRAGT